MGRISFVCTLLLPFVCGNLSLAPEMQRIATPVTVPCLPSFLSKDGWLGGDGGTSVFALEFIGVYLATLSNLSSSPEEWEVKYWKLVDGGKLIEKNRGSEVHYVEN